MNKNTSTQSNKAPFPNAATLAMREMMETIDAMRGVYVRETDALTRGDTKGFFSLQDEKMNAARRYQGTIDNFLAHKDALKAADPSLKSRLEAMYKDFAIISEKNMQALQRMGRCVEHLGNTMRNAAKQEAVRQRSFSYGQSGVLHKAEHKAVSMGVSETV